MAIGIIGPPQSGKTTVFNAVTRGRAEVASFRAPGRQPNVGVVKVPDPRLGALAAMTRSRRVIPAEVSYVDAPGAAEGGIDGVYLNTLQRCEALLLVARAFDDPSAPAPGGVVDPVRDAQATQAELAFSDLLLLERRAERIAKQLRAAKASERDALTREAALVDRVRGALDGGAAVREQALDAGERRILDNFQLLTAKPLMAVFNIGEEDVGKGEVEAALAERLAAPGVAAIALCGKLEMELAQMAPEDEAEFRASLGAGEPGLDRMVRLCYRLLGLVSFLTTGEDETRAWTITDRAPAVEAAGKIHSDIQRGFIRAEVTAYDDLMRAGGFAEARRAGLLRQEGKQYPMRDGDVVNFLFNV